MKSVSVFCGSSAGTGNQYSAEAMALGKALALKDIMLVYGGAKLGLMGAVANGALSVGGKVVGVLPGFLQSKEIAHTGLTEMILVESMHERKMKMNDLSEGIIALPGGYGTLEEFFEMLTWAQLGLHQKPVALLNIDGFYDPLITLLQLMVDKGFLKEVNQRMLIVNNNIENLLRQMQEYRAPAVPKWITKETT